MFWRKEKETIQMEYMLVFKQEALDTIKRAKGYKTDAELARSMDFTRQYLCSLRKRKTACTHEVVLRTAIILGDTQGKWWNHFEIIKVGLYNPDHQKWNQLKNQGQQPYTKRSIMAELRAKDGPVEVRS